MSVFEIRRFELQGRDDEHLRQRLSTFRQAVHSLNGSILDVRFASRAAANQYAAAVVYELPVASRDPAEPLAARAGAA